MSDSQIYWLAELRGREEVSDPDQELMGENYEFEKSIIMFWSSVAMEDKSEELLYQVKMKWKGTVNMRNQIKETSTASDLSCCGVVCKFLDSSFSSPHLILLL